MTGSESLSNENQTTLPGGVLDARVALPTRGGASFSWKNRLVRALWCVVWWLLAAWTPVPCHRWRIALIRLFGGQVEWTAHIYPTVAIWNPRNLKMEHYSCLGPRVICYCMAPISLGTSAVVSQGTHLCTGMHDIDDAHFQLIARPITVESGAWIAAEAFVGPGVTVGRNAVVGARSVLFKSIEEGSVFAGNPAQFIRKRRAIKHD